ncbi:MAG: TrkH family potassium uptake protein, partial [Muribaculaceae bacterium]|nr:TrkH family potassium uptake protein [Muribaculaceae bacterium]
MKTSLRIGAMTGIVGRLVLIDAAILLLPMAVSLIYGESDWLTFLIASAAAAVTGLAAIYATRRCREPIRAREGFIITAVIWVVFGFFGIIPLMTCSHPLDFTDAMFEIISGYTTTGASVITDVQAMSHGILFWRALSQWIGGLGIILFMLALLPELNKSIGISMFNAEATGITHGKIHPRIRQTALALWAVYVTLTVVSVILLWIGPMDLFDSVCHTFAAIATGGFSTRNDGLLSWHSDYIMCVMTGVMFVGGLNFLLLFNMWKGDVRGFFRNSGVRVFTAMTLCAYLLALLSALLRGET